ncbi:PAS domain-containing protein [Zobellia galactanivorans]|uniref:PAS domain-containing protein n=1 Tax=Zobellia galactanivorans (strain DSM 12802 / CCUG 47099 / CIP 106680 / NCIMB 13871 / Dsij) TaxID=63186 RepID=UPI001C079F6C|nr:PAS domain-containing protein [Zobellia galactanivorans]MBU3025228.1 PAS domain-containing protein [Zobellia galactanivorans]
MNSNIDQKIFPFMEGGGEMGELTRNKNWETTSLGAPDTWPQSLRTTLSIVLNSRFPMYVFWGGDYTGFYNDAYRVSLGNDGKHPLILGMKGKEAWPEIWDTIQPLLISVSSGKGATWSENQLIPIYRNGKIEEAYWTFSYSPVKDEMGDINGILVTCSETTNNVNTMKNLEESENELQFAMNAAELCTWDYNPITNKFKSNDRLKEWFRLPLQDEIQLNDAMTAILEQDQQRVSEEIVTALNYDSGGKYDIIYTINNKQMNQTRIVRAVGRSWFNEKKIAYRFNGILQDITEDKIAQQKIQESEKKFRNLVKNVPIGIAIISAKDYEVNLINDKALDIWNTKRDQTEGRPIFEVLTEIESGLRPIFENVIQTQTAQSGMEYPFNFVRNGQTVTAYFNFIFSPSFDDKGDVDAILCVASEVTESVIARHHVLESEAEFQNLVLQSPIAMAILRGKNLKIEMANQAMLSHFWRKKEAEILGKNLLDIFPELKTQEYPAFLHSVMNTGKSLSVKESHALVKSNDITKEYYVDFDYVALKELDGSISGVMLTVTDVTNSVVARQKLENFSRELEQQVLERTELLKAANEKLEDTVQELKKSNDELESFAYISSHDLQEPLRKIQMMTSRILSQEKQNFSEKGRQYFDRVISSADRMRTLIEDLLEFSRTSKQEEDFEPHNLTLLLEQVIENLSEKIELTNTEIKYDDLGEAKVIPFQIRQVFQNLLENSIKFAKPDTHPKIEIKAKKIEGTKIKNLVLDAKQTYLQLSFSDNGIGFEAQYGNQIFEIFKRLHGKLEYQGTGIGLAIVKKIAINHDGAITATGTLGKGSVFCLYLPIT